MSMTRAAAEKVMQELLVAGASLNEAVRVVQTEAPDLFAEFRRHAGEVIGAIYLDLMKPVVRDYPDLDPGAAG
jgi:hypothetical protein